MKFIGSTKEYLHLEIIEEDPCFVLKEVIESSLTILGFQKRKTSLKAKEKEVGNLVVSQINNCKYCLSAHTVIGKMNGFDDSQILEIRSGSASFDVKLDVLAKTTKAIVENKGRIQEVHKTAFFEAGYTEENLINLVVVFGDKTISNYIHNIADFAIDFPIAEELKTDQAYHIKEVYAKDIIKNGKPSETSKVNFAKGKYVYFCLLNIVVE